jgi:hypothetical protein
MNTAEAILRERGIGRAELGVDRENTRGLRFYERLGWRIVEPLCETFSYSGFDGMPVSERLEQWLLAKDLSRLARRA